MLTAETACADDRRKDDPERQKSESARNGFLGTGAIADCAEHESEDQANKAITEIECDPFEREYGGAMFRIDNGVEVIRNHKS